MSKKDITVTLQNGRTVVYPVNTPIEKLLPEENQSRKDGLDVIGAMVNNDVVSLTFPLEVDSHIRFLTMGDAHGWRIYRRSVSFILAKAVRELYPSAKFSIEHSLGTGFYCHFEMNGRAGITEEQLDSIGGYMLEMVAENSRIERRKISYGDAVKQFEGEGQIDKFDLLRFRNPSKVVIYECDGFSDLAHGPMARYTGTLGHFKLIHYPPGFVIQFPERENAPHFAKFEEQPHLFQIFREHKQWGRILGVQTAGQLNAYTAGGETEEFIRIAEALHEKKIARIADNIAERNPQVKSILVAGPSSSGKTTFSKRLAVQLKVNGLQPVTISVDDYFVDREHTPRDEHGQLDFEHIETIDLKLFNEHLRALDAGEEVELPKFNFAIGKREYKGNKMKIGEDQLLIIEGIHALNPRLTEQVPAPHKFKVYVSALTQLNLDFNNRISTTDNRLIRRMIRDNRFRGNSALATLQMWPNVRRGEKRWVFPFQNEADIAFNSALDYELAVLKSMVEPLLLEIKPHHLQYAEARRLQDFLRGFIAIPVDQVPPTSILREFTGKSNFRY